MEPSVQTKAVVSSARRRLLIGTAGAALAAIGGGARALAATDYPSKPLRVVIPYPPGGPTDIVGRIVSATLSDKLGQSVVIENRPGASGMIGADMVAKAAPDGYTLLINVSGQLINPALYTNMSHDPLKDFSGITNLASTPIQLIVSANSPVRSVADLIALVRSQPGRHNFASSSNGTPGHLAGEAFKAAAKLDVTLENGTRAYFRRDDRDRQAPIVLALQARADGRTAVEVKVAPIALPPLESTPPPEFDGPEGYWSPETLLLASVADCYSLSVRAIARASRLEWQDLSVDVEGVLDRVDGVTRFVHLVLRPRLVLAEGQKETLARTVLEKAERACLISNSLNAVRELQPSIEMTAGADA